MQERPTDHEPTDADDRDVPLDEPDVTEPPVDLDAEAPPEPAGLPPTDEQPAR